MEQIYYTQCPVGYGLGASNGFQIKRLSAGYPLTGDFRHLGLKAFPGGGRALAPPALRYRRDGETAEVAWLTPRAHEYETERGPWGRPGGVFAHGLRLVPVELAAIRQWPAGLFDSPLWKRTDREPTRGRPPDDVSISAATLIAPPTFAGAAPLAQGVEPGTLARLLTALALAVREGRTLFLVDDPARLGPKIAVLTFAFPEVMRPDLTFSTFHDRPEELPGFRIQGTTALARPNRQALTALGIVADLAAGTFEPRVEPEAWAVTLAGWFDRRDAVDEADWSATDARARVARGHLTWAAEWLDHLFGFDAAYRDRTPPGTPAGWRSLGEFARWAGASGSGEEWLRPRGPAWWRQAAPSADAPREARQALLAHAALKDAWREESHPREWGEAVALWFRDAEAAERDESLAALLRAIPRDARPAFARALLRGLTPEGASAVLDRLRDDPSSDRGMLLPLEAGAAVASIVQGGDPGSLAPILVEARSLPGVTSAVLDAIEAGLADQPESLPLLTRAAVEAFDFEGPTGGREALSWALRRGTAAADWLGPALRPILADPDRLDLWRGLRDRTTDPLRASFARVVLRVADDPGLPDEAFRWGVEGVLLPLAPRPGDPSWADTYLRRIPSDLELIRRLFSPEYRKLGVPTWIDEARSRGEVSEAQAARVDNGRAYARSLRSGDAQSLLRADVPGVPPEERGALLGQMLAHVGGSTLEGLPFVLDACRGAWPDAFRAGARGLRNLAQPLARCLEPLKLEPVAWLDKVGSILIRLGLADDFEPDGLAGQMAWAAARGANAANPWPLRQYLLRHPVAWRLLAADIRGDLAEAPVKAAAEVLLRWDQKLVQERPERFFEAFLNACDGPRLAVAVAARGADLKSLPATAWWDHASHPSAFDDLRDAYARLAPLAPLPEGRLFVVRNWVQGSGGAGMSAPGLDRWRCLEAITNFRQAGTDASARWPVVVGWEADLPLGRLGADDKYRFLAWLVADLEAAESYQVARLARWLKNAGVDDVDRVGRWADELDGLAELEGQTRLNRSSLVGELKSELMTLIREERGAKRARPADGKRSGNPG